MYFFMFLYFCAISAHKLGTGFDAIFLRVTFIVYVGMWALNIISSKSRLVVNNYVLWLFLFYGYCCLSMWWAKSILDSEESIGKIIQIIVIGLTLVQLISENKDIEKVLKILLYSQIYSAIVLIIKAPTEMFGEERLTGVTGLHANTIGFRFATSIFLCIYFLMKKRGFKAFYISISVGFAVLILFTGSRKSFIMTIAFLTTFVVLYKSKDFSIMTLYKKILLFAFVILVALTLWYFAMNDESFYNVIGRRLQSMFETFVGSANDSSINERGEFRVLGYELFKKHPIIGYGLNNFIAYTREVGFSHIAYSHDNFVELLSTLGIVGTALFYIPLVFFCFSIYKACIKSNYRNLGIVIFTFLSLEIVFSSYSMFYCDEFYFVFAVCGYMYYYINYKVKKGTKI